jgi:hypothetical protein
LRKLVTCAYNDKNPNIKPVFERRLRMPNSSASHLESLQARHRALAHKIELEQSRPGSSDWYLKALKTQKLHLKERIEGIAG